MQITEAQAHIALSNLLSAGRVTESDVSRAISEEIAKTQARLAHIRGELIPITSESLSAAVAPVQKRRKQKHVSPQQAESRKVQGIYMNLIRNVPQSRRGQYQALAKESGREAAILAMRAARFH